MSRVQRHVAENLNDCAISLLVCRSFYGTSNRCQYTAALVAVARGPVEHAEGFGFARHSADLLRIASVWPHVTVPAGCAALTARLSLVFES
jgi:hypothetical protein